MSLLPETNMMISTTKQLNEFAQKAGVKHHGQLLPKLIEHKELVTSNIARLVTRHTENQSGHQLALVVHQA